MGILQKSMVNFSKHCNTVCRVSFFILFFHFFNTSTATANTTMATNTDILTTIDDINSTPDVTINSSVLSSTTTQTPTPLPDKGNVA